METGNVPKGARRLTLSMGAVPPPRAEDYQRLLQISLQLNGSEGLEDLLARILVSARELLDAEDASLMLLDRDGRTLTFGAIDSPFKEALQSVTLDVGEGVAGWVALHNEPLIVDDAYADPRFSAKGDAASGHRTANMICVPLLTTHRTIGTLEVINKKKKADALDLPLCLSLANIAALALENMQLRHEAEQNLARVEEVQRSRIEFFHVLSHELRTPLAVVHMGLSILKSHTDRSEVANETLASMAVNANRLKGLIQDMFIINDIDTLASRLLLRPTRVEDVLKVMDPMHLDRSSRNVRVHIDAACARHRIMVDREKIAHCIVHLLDNAHKFSSGGPVHVEVEPEVASGMMRFSVSDEGIGIDPAQLDFIFDLFYQADSSNTREYGGTGIGLYICRHIVQAHGGKLWCHSQPGEGSTFSFTLPLASAAGTSAPAPTAADGKS